MGDQPTPAAADARGAYGLCLPALAGAARWMQPQAADAPCLRLRVSAGSAGDGPSTYDDRAADLRLRGGGRLQARRGAEEVHYMLPAAPPDADLLHPYLAPAAALTWRWAGREAIHGGVIAGRDGAVLLLGGRCAGKSTTLAWLASAGVPVLADDLAILDGDRVLAGPRSIDVRATGDGDVRGGDRRRVSLPPAPPSLALAGVAVLAWGDTLNVAGVRLAQRWGVLARQRSFPALPANLASVLELVAVPTFRVTRPRDVAAVPGAGAAIIECFL